ncbi:DUF1214 domain-containing protein [Kitasatospora hibisci]|uniref:DUF1214 domain-containing protein n=1 Tax=Kitasatospora hibisci TaxID=3369522 RepID=UPI0037548BF6
MLYLALRNRWKWLTALLALGVLLGASSAQADTTRGHSDDYRVSRAYIERFYPRWFSYEQTRLLFGGGNTLFGPDRVTPLYGAVVAINVDTLYASAVVEPTQQPVILTVPETSVSYSLLTATPFGDVFDSGIPAGRAGTYALTAPGWHGSLPPGATRITVPYPQSFWIFRADKYASDGQNTVRQAEEFRRSLHMATLPDYQADSNSGPTAIVPEALFAVRYKVIADNLVRYAPITFLRQLQTAVHDPGTPPLTGEDKAVAARFDHLFGDGTNLSPEQRDQFAKGARDGHTQIVDNYLNHTGSTNWVNFQNIGNWAPSAYLDRSSIAEFLQWGNNLPAAAYWHAFKDCSGAALDGAEHGYVLKFPAGALPEVSRFWSITAYTPEAITLIPNDADTYAVASYTPGLEWNQDGSLSIYVSRTRPQGVNPANWLPVGDGPFNIMLRAYGPQGAALDGSYVPPAIEQFPAG